MVDGPTKSMSLSLPVHQLSTINYQSPLLPRQRGRVDDLRAFVSVVQPLVQLRAQDPRPVALPLLLPLLRGGKTLLQLQDGVAARQLHRPGRLSRLEVGHGFP